MVNQQIRVCMLYEYRLGHNASTATRNINEAWGEDTLSERTTQWWFKKFRSGDMNLENQERGRPGSVIDNDQLKALVEADKHKTVRELAEDLNVNISTISRHLQSIGKVKKLDKWVPHELNEKQKNRRFEICSSLLLRNKNDPFLARIITWDEKWILYDNRRRSAQWLDAETYAKTKPSPEEGYGHWWSATGVIHYSFLKPGETITAEKYCREIEVVHQKLAKKQSALVNRKGPIVLHDNARPHDY
jgi:histone-lysine N-methyltransferase SETMAR